VVGIRVLFTTGPVAGEDGEKTIDLHYEPKVKHKRIYGLFI